MTISNFIACFPLEFGATYWLRRGTPGMNRVKRAPYRKSNESNNNDSGDANFSWGLLIPIGQFLPLDQQI